MTWSTQQLAEIANTTANTVRHYHKVGLLPLPERAANGYKRYGIPHLVRLITIRRLSELGIPLRQIAAMDRDDDASLEDLRTLDNDLAETIERLTRVRRDLALTLQHHAPPETPPGFASLAPELTERQRSLLAVYSSVFDGPTLQAFREALYDRDATDDEFDDLPEDVDDLAVEDLARRMLPSTRRTRDRHPELVDPVEHSPQGPETAGLILAHAMVELYNPAQLRVLQHLDRLLAEEGATDDDPRRTT